MARSDEELRMDQEEVLSALIKIEEDALPEQRQKLENLRELIKIANTANEARLQFFKLSSELMMITRDNCIELVNQQFLTSLGYKRHEAIGKNYEEFVYKPDLAKTRAVGVKFFQGTEIRNFENRWVKKSGELIHLSWTCTADVGAKVAYAAARDVTEMKRNERELAEKNIQLVLAAKFNSLGKVAAGIAHEIKNPLTIIFGNSLLIEDAVESQTTDSGKILRLAKAITKMSERIDHIINGLRTLARDASRDEKSFVSLSQVVADTLALCEAQATVNSISIYCEDIPETAKVLARQTELSQVLLNLVENAIDSLISAGSGEISVSLVETEQQMGLSITDNGGGIPKDIADHIFDPFFTTKAPGKGTGLGLSISRGIVESYAGSLEYKEIAGNTNFTFLLPKVQSGH